MTEDVVYEYKSQNVMISDVDLDLHSVLSETDVEDDWDDDSLTTVTSLDNMSCDSELLSILDGDSGIGAMPDHTDEKHSQLSPCDIKLCDSTNENEMALDDEGLDLSELELMFTCSESKAIGVPEKQPDYVLFMSLPTVEDLQ